MIDEYLSATKGIKRSWKDDERYAKVWKDRFGGRALDEIAPAELERIRTGRLDAEPTEDGKRQAVKAATANREFAFLRRVYNIAIRDDKTARNPVSARFGPSWARRSEHRGHADRSIVGTDIGIVTTGIGPRGHPAGRASSPRRVAGA